MNKSVQSERQIMVNDIVRISLKDANSDQLASYYYIKKIIIKGDLVEIFISNPIDPTLLTLTNKNDKWFIYKNKDEILDANNYDIYFLINHDNPVNDANIAIELGDINSLILLEKYGIYPDQEHINIVAGKGYLNILQHLSKYIMPNIEGANMAYKNGHKDVVEWLHQNNIINQII